MLPFNWETLTASESLVPFATLVIALLPALIPFLVTDGPPVIVIPSLFTLVSPIVKEPSLVRLRSLFILTVKVLSPSATTAMLPAADLNS